MTGCDAELERLRRRIDRIDTALVRLLAARQRKVELIALIKGDPERVRDPRRVAEVLRKVQAEARRAGLSERIVEPVWRELLEGSAREEQALLRARRPQGSLDMRQPDAAEGSSRNRRP